MEGSSGFQGPMPAHCQYLYQPFPQAMGQNLPLEGQPPPLQVQPLPLQVQPPPLQGQPPANNFTVQPPNNGSITPQWTDLMVRLMITAISYLLEGAEKSTHMSKIIKWKVISMVMSERGHNVTPQQCEEKFLEINKKYKQLIMLLGKPTSCKVFENPILLDSIEMPERKKDEVRKLLGSGQLYYQELCSLHHNNHMFIPHDWEVRRSVLLGITGSLNGHVEEYEREVLQARWARLEEKKLEIQEKRLKLEKMRFEWSCLDHSEEMEMEKMRLENEELKFENARLAFQLKRRGMTIGDDDN